MKDADEQFRSWQTPDVRSEYQRTESLYPKWFDCYEADGVDSIRQMNDSTSLIDRNSNF